MGHANSSLISPLTRTSLNQTANSTQNGIVRLEEKLLRLQLQSATGKRLIRGSDDPIATGRINSFRVSLDRIELFKRSVETITSHLELADSSLGGINDQILEAKNIGSNVLNTNQVGISSSELSTQISQILNQSVSMANTKTGRTFLFAGKFLERKPFELLTDSVLFTGDSTSVNLKVDSSSTLGVTASPSDSLNVLSGVLKGENSGGNEIDLNPVVASMTSVTQLNASKGIIKGTLRFSAVSQVDVSLVDIEDVGDLIALINKKATSIGVTASINASKNGLTISKSGGGALKITDLDDGKTAKSIGIYNATATATPITGLDIDPILSIHTQLKDLNGGIGISLSGFVITNSTTSETFQSTITGLASTSTIGGLMEKINSSDAQVFTRFNSKGTGIDIYSRLSGARLAVTENSGTTASNLGLLYNATTLKRMKLKDLNAGYGFTTIEGDDIKFTLKNGSTVQVDVDDTKTMRGLIDLINQNSNLVASAPSSGNLVVRDLTSGSGTFSITNIGNSFAATELGIEKSVTGTGTLTVTGSTISFVGVEVENLFTGMLKLKKAVENSDQSLIRVSVKQLSESSTRLTTARSIIGWNLRATTFLKDKFDQEELRLGENKSLSEDVNLSEVLSEFQLTQVILQSALATTARILQFNLFNFL
ncbi:MAG: hypothetical protein HY606_08320 [Planctomycetes bacterium]|nr:hypothetical protein [Planctomycetota bacterium]